MNNENIDNEDEEIQRIHPKHKVAYEIAVLDRIKEIGRQRVISPDRGFINAVKSLECILFPNERKEIDKYKYDTGLYEKEVIEAYRTASECKNKFFEAEILLNMLKPLSWLLYRQELEKCLNNGTLPDVDLSGQPDKGDILVLSYEALLQHIIMVLKKYDWLVKGNFKKVGGGGVAFDDDLGIEYE